MSVLMIRYQASEQGAADVASAVEATFAALNAQRPTGIRYAYYCRAGSTEFIALLELADGVENPLFGIDAARRLQSAVAKSVVGDAPKPQPLELLGSYDSLSG